MSKTRKRITMADKLRHLNELKDKKANGYIWAVKDRITFQEGEYMRVRSLTGVRYYSTWGCDIIRELETSPIGFPNSEGTKILEMTDTKNKSSWVLHNVLDYKVVTKSYSENRFVKKFSMPLLKQGA